MPMPRLIAALLLLLAGVRALAAPDSAQTDHLRVRLMVLPQSLSAGGAADAGLYFKLEPGWHIYFENSGDSGLPPHVHWSLPEGVRATALEFPQPRRLPLGPFMDYGYEDEVLFPFTVQVDPGRKAGPATLGARVDWLVCRETCIPGKAELSVTRNIVEGSAAGVVPAEDAAIFRRFQSRVPRPLPAGDRATFAPSDGGFRLEIVTGQRERSAAFFPLDPSIIDNPAPQKVTPTSTGLILDLKKDANLTADPTSLRGVLELSGGRAFHLVAQPVRGTGAAGRPVRTPPSSAPAAGAGGGASAPPSLPATAGFGRGLLRASGLALLGGMLLNLMPCVFPVLFLKGLALVNAGSEQRRSLRAHGLVYAAGILASFWALVGVLVALRGAGERLGWGFQFQSPVFLTLMASLLFFLGLSLAGQFDIGLSLTSAGGSLAAKRGYAGSFFTGVLAVIVATPCTAPFMGAAIGYALAQPPAVTFEIFTALAVGLAAPYVALTLQPAWTRLLPRPGAWMEVVKQATAVPVFATVIWLASVLAEADGAASLAALLACLLLLAIAGWFLGRGPGRRWATATAGVILAGAVALGALAPARLRMEAPAASTTAVGEGWEPWSADAVARYQAQGRPVFVDFTASWCLSCQVNERVALNQPDVRRAFTDAHVARLRADWTHYDGSIARELTSLGRSGVPAYVLYVPGRSTPELLPEVLTPGIVTDALGRLTRPSTQARAASSNL